MHRLVICLVLVTAASAAEIPVPGGVPWWGYRGLGGTGVVAGDPPVACDDATGMNVLWKVPVANWGHSQPVVLGDAVLVVSEGGWPEGQDFPVVECFALADGALRWELTLDHLPSVALAEEERERVRSAWADVLADFRLNYRIFHQIATAETDAERVAARKRFEELGRSFDKYKRGYGQLRSLKPKCDQDQARLAAEKAGLTLETWQHGCGMGQSAFGQTFPTPVTDGEHVYIATAFGSFFCLDRDGEVVWTTFAPGQRGEYCRNGRSPLIYGDLLISDVTALARGIDRATGEVRWSHPVGAGTWMNPVVITVDGVDVLLCHNRKAFRLPDGEPLTVEGGTDFGAMAVVKYDERDVVFFTGGGEHGGWTNKGNCPTPPPSAVRFALDGDTLDGEILWSGIDGEKVTGHVGILYHDGRLYHEGTGSAYDPHTGKLLAGPGDRKEARDRGTVAATDHLLWIADGRMYGLKEARRSKEDPRKLGFLEVRELGGRRLATNLFRNADGDETKRAQIVAQNGFGRWGKFSYAKPFTVHGDRLFVRNYDHLWCVGHAVRGTPADDEEDLAAIAAASSAAELLPYLDHAGARCRYEATRRLIELADPAASDALEARLADDPQPEVRAAAVRALDAIDPDAKPGTTALRDFLQPIAQGAMRHWWKAEKTRPWELHKHVLTHLGIDGAPIYVELLAADDDDVAASAAFMLEVVDWRESAAIRDALIGRMLAQSGGASGRAARLLARDPVHPDAMAGFRELVAEPGEKDHGQLATAVRTIARSLDGEDRVAFLMQTLRGTAHTDVFTAAGRAALALDPRPADLLSALEQRATGPEPRYRVPRAAAGLLVAARPKDAAADALAAVLAMEDRWTAGAAADGILTLRAGHVDEALAALEKFAAGGAGCGAEAVARLLEQHERHLEDAARRETAVAALTACLAYGGRHAHKTHKRACQALQRYGADAAPAAEALRRHAEGKREDVAKAAKAALEAIGE